MDLVSWPKSSLALRRSKKATLHQQPFIVNAAVISFIHFIHPYPSKYSFVTMAAGTSSSNVRQRRTNNKKNKAKKPTATETTTQDQPPSQTTEASPDDENASLWSIFRNHWSFPLYVISLLIGIPYGLYLGYHYVLLQKPESVAPVFNLRPAVALSDPRQVLIVGTMSSGTSQVADDLKKHFGLEMGHENSETLWNFVRDGTVSWFHGIRFLDKPSNFTHTTEQLCSGMIPHMGFHPRMFRDDSSCSVREKWSACWKRECTRVLEREWGCAQRDVTEGDEFHAAVQGCISPFQTTLHQVRHPLRTVESMVVKFCIDGIDGKLQPPFVKFANALFGETLGGQDFAELSCIEGTTHYLLEYTKGLMQVDGVRRYQVETTSPCDVLEMAGFLSKETAIYAPHRDRLAKKCYPETSKPAVREPMISTVYKINKGNLELTWADLEGGVHGSKRLKGDTSLVNSLQKLTKDLGYEV